MSARVPFVDLARDHAPLRAELHAAAARQIDAGDFVLGEQVTLFEREFAAYCGTRECVGVGSGTAALTIALLAAGVGRGDEVIVPAHTYIATALAVLHAGAQPVLCDVDPDTGLIDPAAAETVVGPRTAAIVPVHLYGRLCPMEPLTALARRHGLFVLEDAAQAHGAARDGRRAGSLGAAAAFSFYPSKNLGALGDGGAVCTSDAALAERARRLRDLGQRAKGEHVEAGFNERLDTLQAALLRVKLPHLDAWNGARRAHAARYRELLPAALRTPADDGSERSVHHLFPVRARDRDRLRARLDAHGIGTGVHYSPSLADQPALADCPRPRAPLTEAEAWAREELSLPMFPGLRSDEIERVAATVAAALDGGLLEVA
jgi:dTDP-4-amino-4,6-dideoxygalactose transaminase